ncbi:MAG TPA: ABC transporter substrate-binding protein [Gammaproteobacteria bacterium]|nr:ABC transporter substrate-binding protein [Gammaproteobacteria bacterium]
MRAAALLLAFASLACAAAPARIASINLCTDALLLELADPGRIASITALSRDPTLSVHAARARTLPVNHGRAEELLVLAPDLVLADGGSSPATVTLLRRLGLNVETLPTATTLPEVIALVHRAGELIGAPARAAALAERLAALARRPAPDAPRALIVQPGGYVPGPDTLGPTLLALAGLRDLAPSLGLGRGGFANVEALLLARPEPIVRGRDANPGRAIADDFLSHPALEHARRAHGGMRAVAVSDAAWACGSASLIDAVRDLRAAVAGTP